MSIISELRSEMSKIQDKISLIQSQCSHPEASLSKEHHSSDGGYDNPMRTEYWTDFTCGLCEKRWRVEGSK